jgi:hypothetical protein
MPRKEGTLRLMNEKNEVTPFKGGRLEVFINEKWGNYLIKFRYYLQSKIH